MVPFSLNLNYQSDKSSLFKFGLQFCGVTPKKWPGLIKSFGA